MPKLSASRARLALYFVLGLAVVVLLILGGRRAAPYAEQFAAWVNGLGALGPLVFILGYAIATVAFIPGSVLTGAAGYFFGLAWGTLYTMIGATLGASAAFLIARYLARGAIERRIADDPRFAAIDKAVEREGFKIVALLRLSPVFPFNLLNYALGLTKVRFLHYFAASAAMLPGTLLYVYYGATADSLTAASSGKTEKGFWDWVVLALGMVITFIVSTYVARLAGRALRQEIGTDV